jgi:Putative phage tail protein
MPAPYVTNLDATNIAGGAFNYLVHSAGDILLLQIYGAAQFASTPVILGDTGGNTWILLVQDGQYCAFCAVAASSGFFTLDYTPENLGGQQLALAYCDVVNATSITATAVDGYGSAATASITDSYYGGIDIQMSILSPPPGGIFPQYWPWTLVVFDIPGGATPPVILATLISTSPLLTVAATESVWTPLGLSWAPGANGYPGIGGWSYTGAGAPAGDVVTDICLRAGLTAAQIDVSLLTDTYIFPNVTVAGYMIEQPRSAAEILKVLMQAFFFDACESGGKVRFIPRGMAAAMTIPEADLGLVEDKGKLISEEIGQSQDLPYKVTVTYNDPVLDYQQNKQMIQRNTAIVSTKQQTVLAIPMTMDADWAMQVATKALYLFWLGRFKYAMRLYRAIYLLLDPTDVIDFVYETLAFTARIAQNSLGAGYQTELDAVSDNPEAYVSSATGGTDQGFTPAPVTLVGPTQLWLFDIPLLADGDANAGGTGFYFAMSSQVPEWGGGVLYESSDDSTFDDEEASSSSAAIFGYATTTLGAPRTPWDWDETSTLTIQLTIGSLAGDTQVNVLNGTNRMIVGSEIIGFENAVQNSDGTWTISGLLRGLRGTEAACGTHGSSELVILIASGMVRVDDSLGLIGQALYYRAVTLGQDVSTAPTQQFTIAGNDLKPYAPAGVGGYLDGSNNMIITWVRRTRIGGEADWADGVPTVPLSEDSELYDVDIYNGATLVRTISDLTTPTAVYTVAMQTADFGSPPSSIAVKVYQKSGEVGRGNPGSGSVPTPAGWPPPWAEELPGSDEEGELFYVNGS